MTGFENSGHSNNEQDVFVKSDLSSQNDTAADLGAVEGVADSDLGEAIEKIVSDGPVQVPPYEPQSWDGDTKEDGEPQSEDTDSPDEPSSTRPKRTPPRRVQASVKAAEIPLEVITLRPLGSVKAEPDDEAVTAQLKLIKAHVSEKRWADADELTDHILGVNPNHSAALCFKLMIRHKCNDMDSVIKNAQSFSAKDCDLLKKFLDCSDVESAALLIDKLYGVDEFVNEAAYCRILNITLSYDFYGREERIREDFLTAISKDRFKVFNILLTTLRKDDVDGYIKYHFDFAAKTQSIEHKAACLDAIIAVDSGNLDALHSRFDMHWNTPRVKSEQLERDLDEILKYSKGANDLIQTYLSYAIDHMRTREHSEFAKAALDRYSRKLSGIMHYILDLSKRMIECEFFDDAEHVLNVMLSSGIKHEKIYWNLCLVRTKAKNEKGILKSGVLLESLPEYEKYIAMVSYDRRSACERLVKKQCRRRKFRRIFWPIFIVLNILGILLLAGKIYYSTLPESDYDFKIKKGEVIITGLPNQAEVTIPTMLFDRPVVGISGKASKEDIDKIESVIIPHGVTYIDSYAFTGMYSLKKIVIPDSVVSIGEYAFKSSSSYANDIPLEEVELPAFAADYIPVKQLVKVTVTGGDSVGEGAFKYASNLKEVVIEGGITSISDNAFYHCTALTDVDLGSSIRSIGDSAFAYCNKLTSISLPRRLTSIGDSAFGNCTALTDITVPDSVTSIGNKAFSGCTALTEAIIPDSVVSIGESAFAGCEALVSIRIPFVGISKEAEGVYAHFGAIFGYQKIYYGDEYHLLVDNQKYRFDFPEGLKTVTVGGTEVREGAFLACDTIETVVLSEGVEIVGESAFEGCEAIKTVLLPDSVTTIGSKAFYGCTSLESIDVPGSVKKIEDYAFAKCESLCNVTLRDGTEEIGVSAFDSAKLVAVIIPATVKTIDALSFADSSGSYCTNAVFLCSVDSAPTGWADGWNNSRPTVFGYDESTYVVPTYNFVTNYYYEIPSMQAISVVDSPKTDRSGYVFLGWYDNAELTGDPVTFPYYSEDGATLYAAWMLESEYYDGSSFERAIPVEASSFNVSLAQNESKYYSFTAKSGRYTSIKAPSGSNIRIYLYDEDGVQLDYDYASSYSSAYLSFSAVANETYYIKIIPYTSSSVSATVTIS